MSKLRTALTQSFSAVVGRESELDAIMHAMVCKQHVMLDGLHGTAKSLMASAAFSVFETGKGPDAVRTFYKMLMPGTLPEEVFGPMDMKAFREQATIRINVAGMMPDAHFVFLDEVYRGSDSILSSTLNILNERIFVSGPQILRCPLVTCVGTTNFVSDSAVLAAFQDRWFITKKVMPLSTAEDRVRMVKGFLAKTAPEVTNKLSLTELRELQADVEKVPLSDEIITLYSSLVDSYRKTHPAQPYVSDRRFNWGARAIQAQIMYMASMSETTPAALMEDSSFNVSEAISAVANVIADGTDDGSKAITASLVSVVGSYDAKRREAPIVTDFLTDLERLNKSYDPSKSSQQKLQRTLAVVETMLKEQTDIRDASRITIPALMKRHEHGLSRLEEIHRDIASRLGVSAVERNPLFEEDDDNDIAPVKSRPSVGVKDSSAIF